ncbi:MAG: iron-sulfur cluster assembly protein, partial [Myxococcota bacterium]
MPRQEPTAEAAVREALTTVDEPRLRLPITDLGIVQGVAVDGSSAVVALAEPLPHGAAWAELTRRVEAAVSAVPGVKRVDVDLREMTNEEKVQAGRILKGEPPPNPLAVVDASAAPDAGARTRVN